MLSDFTNIPENWARIREKVQVAAARAGRSLSDVTVMAVTKTVPWPQARKAWECGVRHLGESRVQEAGEKRAALEAAGCRDLTWHLVGHLQTNKAKKAVTVFDAVQSLDSLRLAEVLDREAEKQGKILPCLVEVKVSEESAKQGVLPETLDDVLKRLTGFPRLRVEGLMTLAPYFEDPEKARPYFRRARRLFEKHLKDFRGARPVLSMGMSQDFAVAVEEGATMIRIGTALFGARPKVHAQA